MIRVSQVLTCTVSRSARHKRPLILLADNLSYIAARHNRSRCTATRFNPLPGHVEVLKPRQCLAHAHVKSLCRTSPAHIATLPVAGVALKGQRCSHIALLVGVVGGCYLNQATLGAGLIAGACFLAILARIAQAHNQHLELMDEIGSQESNTNEEDQPH